MTLFLAVVSLVAAVTNLSVSFYQKCQRKKDIGIIDATIKAISADSKSSEETLRKEISSIRDHAAATRVLAESKALRNTVVVSTSDHAQIVKDHRR